eukprot:1895160-Amphidinium_carterae.1
MTSSKVIPSFSTDSTIEAPRQKGICQGGYNPFRARITLTSELHNFLRTLPKTTSDIKEVPFGLPDNLLDLLKIVLDRSEGEKS